MTSRSIGEVANYRPLAQCGMEELAARQATIVPSGGVLFARTADRRQKTAARQRVLNLFQPEVWDRSLHIFTMPGLHWRFERLLLGARETGWMHAPRPHRTLFTSIENDRALYFAAAAQMPGVHTPDAIVRSIKPARLQPFAEMGVKTRYGAFFFANVHDLMLQNWDSGWDAAWLDYTGPLSVERLRLIRDFYHRSVREILIVTAMGARWDERTVAAIEAANGYWPWLFHHLPGEILHAIEYYDTVPMLQFAVRHIR
jgi:hypothetical protein